MWRKVLGREGVSVEKDFRVSMEKGLRERGSVKKGLREGGSERGERS